MGEVVGLTYTVGPLFDGADGFETYDEDESARRFCEVLCEELAAELGSGVEVEVRRGIASRVEVYADMTTMDVRRFVQVERRLRADARDVSERVWLDWERWAVEAG